jgi:uncharacterized protein (AIM24 family)
MAKFEVEELEGMHYVKITLDNETVHAERGALSSMTGDITMDARLPSIGRLLKSYLSEESAIRPTYTGSGIIFLESSFAGFHVFEPGGETWILDSGTYWASEGPIALGAHREAIWTSFWAGEGFIDWQTKVSGPGKVVLTCSGPVEEIQLEKGKPLVDNGKCVIARTADVSYGIRRATKSYLASLAAGEGYCRYYDGPGRVLVCYSPYWRYRMFAQQEGQPSPAPGML